MNAFVQSNQVVNTNGENFAWPVLPNGIPMQIPCQDTQIIGGFWRIPKVQGNRVIGYTDLVATDSNKPQSDAIKVLRVKLTGTGGITQIDMAIADSDYLATTSPPCQFAYLCDGNGGTLPVMPAVTIPVPIMQSGPQFMDGSTSTFVFPFPANPTALEYQVNGMWINGISITPNMSGLTTVTAVASSFNSAYGDYGTWSASSTNVLQLASATTDVVPAMRAGIDVELEPTDFCFDLTAYSTPEAVDGVQFGSGNIIPVTAFMLTDDPVVLYNVLKNVMSSGTTFDTTSEANKLGINTVQAQPKLYYGEDLVEASDAGACS